MKVNKNVICKFCHNVFIYKYKSQKFCSYKCYWNSMSENHSSICQNCNKVFYSWKSYQSKFCSRKCRFSFMSGINHPNWKNGTISKQGYKIICIKGKRYVEHRYLIEQYINRKLTTEHIHHINGIKTDNRLENLYIFDNNSAHIKFESNKQNIKSNIYLYK